MPRAVIFANGLLREPAAVRGQLRADDLIICADGGTHHALALGLQPHLIVGDLDSLPAGLLAEMKAQGVRLQTYPARKDQTDLELAMRAAVAEGADEILLVAALGGRLDQALANILLLARPEWASLTLRLADGRQQGTILHRHHTLTIHGAPGDTLSLVPLTGQVTGITLDGVEWPLQEAAVSLGSTLTISNVLTAPPATVRIAEGIVLVVHIPG